MLREPDKLHCLKMIQDDREVVLKFKDGEASRGAVLSGLLFVADQLVIETWTESEGRVEEVERYFDDCIEGGAESGQ